MFTFLLAILLDFILLIFTITAVIPIYGWLGVAILLGGNVLVIFLHGEVRRSLRFRRRNA